MAKFPTDFSKPQPVQKGLSVATDKTLEFLSKRGLTVLVGIDESLAQSIAKLAREPHIKEYCPNDCTKKRFANLASTRDWLSSGHAVFVLAKPDEKENWTAIGYGWSGPKRTTEVPQGETTFALRIGKDGLGQGLSAPFSQVVIDATTKLYDAKKFWLETWASNAAAVHVYKKLGFKLVNQKPGQRPTANGREVNDTRLFMFLPGN
ncbi:TPA: hypothetical protein DIS56_03410 [Candidatus Saccharibacteria bacterium]|nr:MAG: hypothetical protein UX30_C0005G0058 [Candidatus Saccharibacteria bacterium GW2011_GWA2_46_10]OGL36131.1 MAG: hypothetical protein A3F05_01460 [Candidatus Saccharibacteria bacterium RIFCSPHIGHO2_12_FULL_47_17]HCM52149.1 hypothetical protein [Candidatus Saccharibacteria bacterium]